VQVHQEQPLMEAGLDSLGAVELRNALNETFNTSLPATFTFDNPTITAMASYFLLMLSKKSISTEPKTQRHYQTMPKFDEQKVLDTLKAIVKEIVSLDNLHQVRKTLVHFFSHC
jgi:hypothetical protein